MPLCGKDHVKVIDRISRVEGQVRGLRKMVEEDRDCFEVLKQIAAAAGALRSIGMVLLEDHLRGCVSDAIRSKTNEDELIHQVIEVFMKFTK
ncbi:MAG: metal-sensitive transcriptional regulator [Pseudomonadota bacterium]|jgi:CsoR family transcriptional regulator, copper-sensing transcriptional repressor